MNFEYDRSASLSLELLLILFDKQMETRVNSIEVDRKVGSQSGAYLTGER